MTVTLCCPHVKITVIAVPVNGQLLYEGQVLKKHRAHDAFMPAQLQYRAAV